jgi:NAD(P)-dependent dehydrogenase (short-subunit alcohol dehydrogenase family)
MSSASQQQYILITGASRGLGLETVRQYATTPNTVVLAAARDPATATKLQQIAKEHSNVHILTLDVASEDSIRALPAQVAKYTNYINVLINNAGILESSTSTSTVDLATFHKIYNTNSFAPILITQQLLPFLEKIPRPETTNAASEGAIPAPEHTPRVVMMSSILGSIGKAHLPSLPAYCSAKTALNSLTKLFSLERKDIAFLLLCPGWCQTDMGGAQASLVPSFSVSNYRKIIDSFTLDRSGSYVDYQNQVLPW